MFDPEDRAEDTKDIEFNLIDPHQIANKKKEFIEEITRPPMSIHVEGINPKI